MWRKNKDLKAGYDKPKKDKKSKPKKRLFFMQFLVDPEQKVPISEKIIKIIIYISLRLAIKPSRWKDPQKNLEIIDRTYKRIMSSDFIFIPSSIAFYLIMAFMPIMTIVMFIYSIPGFKEFIESDGRDSIAEVLGKFIPGMRDIIEQVSGIVSNWTQDLANTIPIFFFLIITTWIAAGGFAKIVYTQSYIYGHRFVGGFWMNKIKGMVLVLQLTFILAIALTINILVDREINVLPLNKTAREAIMYVFLIVALFVLVFSMFVIFYRFSPRFKIKTRHVIPGAMVSALPTSLFLIVFGLISNLWSYDRYGTIGAIMYIGMSCLIITYFVFLGITTNASYYKTFVGPRVENKWTISKK